jgi:alpha-D-ribose 1-methylphosphonate 5-triphosphate synthase subunit PhnH
MAAAELSNPVFAAQATFRAVLDAMARPGTIHKIEAAGAPSPLSPTAAAVALTLCDHDTPVWLDTALRAAAPVIEWLRFHCSAPIVDRPCDAAFAFLSVAQELPPLSDFNIGTPDYPDRSTTIVIEVASLRAGVHLTLTGPGGIPERRSFHMDPLPHDFSNRLAANRAHFPCGVDLLLVADGEVAALPRTARLVNEDK